jgi:transcriptional regulator with XRE-family HTH domain
MPDLYPQHQRLSMRGTARVLYAHNVLLVDIEVSIAYFAAMMRDRIYLQMGSIIRSRRKRLSLTQQQLAAQLGISRAALANIEVGRQKVFVHHLYSLAAALRLKPHELLPFPSDVPLDQEWPELPLPQGLKPEQRNQVAQLVDGVGFDNDEKTGRAS